MPGSSIEQFEPDGFQLWVSDGGSDWTQVGEDGFGRDTSLMAGLYVYGETLCLEAFDYHAGSRLRESADGHEWRMIFQEPVRSFFQYPFSTRVFDGHYLWTSTDMERGIDIWRSAEALVAETSTTLTSVQSTTSVTLGGETTITAGPEKDTGDGVGANGEDEPGTGAEIDEVGAAAGCPVASSP